MTNEKELVRNFWNDHWYSEPLGPGHAKKADYELQAKRRYELEPYISEFAGFTAVEGKKVLEIGVGLGVDHQRFAQAGADLHGIDLTEGAVDHTRRRLAAYGLSSKIKVGDAEKLDYPDEYFDTVYSWGVLHHSPATPTAVGEVWRVLKPGGVAEIMMYHKWSVVGLMLWTRYALFRMRPWISLSEIYSGYLESPGTKAYSLGEARSLFSAFSNVVTTTVLTHGDLLESLAGRRHEGGLLSFARRIWPRALVKRSLSGMGLFTLIRATK
jgi:SAM-dependent methyltransferase